MMPMRLATSSASKSEVNLTYAFFCPSGRIRVLTCNNNKREAERFGSERLCRCRCAVARNPTD